MMDESLKLHILTECRVLISNTPDLRNDPFWRSWLTESQGIPSQIDDMLNAIFGDEEVIEFLEQSNQDGHGEVTFDFHELVKDVPGNFIGAKSYLGFQALTPEDVETKGTGGGFMAGLNDLNYNKETGLLDGVRIYIKYPATYKVLQVKTLGLKSTLSHELLHAYEDYCRRKGSDNGSSLGRAARLRKYRSAKGVNDSEINWFHYVMNPAEQRAYIAQSVHDIKDVFNLFKQTGQIDKVKDIRNLDQAIEMTSFGHTYRRLQGWVYGSQWDRLPKFVRDQYIKDYKNLTGKDVSWDQLLKIIRDTWEKFEKTIKTKVSQAVVNALEDVK